MSRLAQSVEHQTLNLRVVGSSPTLGDIRFANDIYLVFIINNIIINFWVITKLFLIFNNNIRNK